MLREEKALESIREIRQAYAGEVPVTVLRLAEKDLESWALEARSLPFLAQAQIFRIRDAETLKAKGLEGVLAVIEDLPPTTHLIFEAESLPQDHELRKKCQATGRVLEIAERERDSLTAQWIQDQIRRAGKTLEPAALERLVDWMGDHPVMLESVLEQMLTYAGPRPVIDEALVARFAERWQELDTFQLVNAISNREMEKALVFIKRMTGESGGDVTALMGMLHWMFKRFWKAAVLLEKGEGQDAALKACKVYPRQAPFFLRQLRMFSRAELEEALEGLFRLDLGIKTGRMDAEAGLESWLIRTVSKGLRS